MTDFDTPGTAVEESMRRPTASSRFADISDRLARTFGGFDRNDPDRAVGWVPSDDPEYPVETHSTALWEPGEPRFPISRHGYDRAAVDEQLGELERELSELRTQRSLATPVAAELDRIGEQTSAVLRVAHEQAQQTTFRARAQAERLIADAEANAAAITEEASRQLRRLDGDTDAVWQERARLIQDVREVANALVTLAQSAADRFPPEAEKLTPPFATVVAEEEREVEAVAEVETVAETAPEPEATASFEVPPFEPEGI
jgi:cell division septum initiation protein DivIVA